MRRGTDGQTETQRDRQTDTQTRVTTIHFASATPHAKCNDDGDDWCAESGGITRAYDTHVECSQLPLPRRTTPDRSVPVNTTGCTPFTRYDRLANRLYNRFHNRLDVFLHDAAGCTTGLTTSLQAVLSCTQTFNRLSNRFDNRFDNRVYRVNGVLVFIIPSLLCNPVVQGRDGRGSTFTTNPSPTRHLSAFSISLCFVWLFFSCIRLTIVKTMLLCLLLRWLFWHTAVYIVCCLFALCICVTSVTRFYQLTLV